MKINSLTSLKHIALLSCMWLLPSGSSAVLAAEDASPDGSYSQKGADTCLVCHGEGSAFEVMPIFMTKHGARMAPDAPFADLQCESCHGSSAEHVTGVMTGNMVRPKLTFAKDDEAPVAEQNEACLNCHQDHAGFGWFGGAHEATDVACVSCHAIHRARDPVFDPLEQQQACFDCHPEVRADTFKASSHPLRFGSMRCSDCHNVHDGNNDFLLNAGTVNDTCFSCHAEKRGPLLWEHAPVSEDCSLCHRPHGSNHGALLTLRPPLLCQQCHASAWHSSSAYTSDAVEDGTFNRFLLARSCMNCHSQVHGSNHPSGMMLTK